MADLIPQKLEDPANPLQPGDPFKRGNFNRFAFGMCLFIAIFLIAAILFFLVNRNHRPTPTPAHPASSALRVDTRVMG